MPKYEFPDHTISLVWSERCGDVWRWALGHGSWIRVTAPYDTRKGPSKGDWLPWTPPVFPEREKLLRRRAWATVDGQRKLVTWHAPLGVLTDPQTRKGNVVAATDIDWIDPEYLDELPPDPRGAK